MPQLDKHDPHLVDILRRASLERAQQDRRIADIFGTQTVPKVTEETLALYLDYLQQHLEVPCQLTGIESLGCFSREASYIFGRRRPTEYAQRKQQQPSYTDTYTFLSFEDAYDPYDGLAVKVKRVSDNKRFVLPLANLKALEKPSNNAQLLDDYAMWFVNGRR
jgi:hypothetical protein